MRWSGSASVAAARSAGKVRNREIVGAGEPRSSVELSFTGKAMAGAGDLLVDGGGVAQRAHSEAARTEAT